jgi:predicted NBD/HSP70 family sugar kinase
MRSDRPAARPDDIRRHNLAVILAQIHRDGPLTRAELTARLGLSRSTIGALVADLTALGFVEESVPNGGERAGRPSHVVGPHSNGPFVVAVDVDVSHLTVAAVGIGGTTLARRVIMHDRVPPAPDEVAERIVAAVAELRETLVRPDGSGGGPAAIGVSVPGTVDRSSGLVGFAPNLGWRNAEFGTLLEAAAVPVVVGNDADLAVLAEHQRGSGRDCDDVVYLIGRIGVGAGIIVNGLPLRGHDGHAGEIGHNVVDASGPKCHCGKNGCLETFIGDYALLERAGRADTGDDAAGRVLADARTGDAEALGAVRAVADSLGQALGMIVNTLNPERIILGGSLADVFGLARPEVEQALEQHALDAPGNAVELSLPTLGKDSALLGAAEMAFAVVLDDPLRDRVLLPR